MQARSQTHSCGHADYLWPLGLACLDGCCSLCPASSRRVRAQAMWRGSAAAAVFCAVVAVPATTRESCGVWVALPATTRESCGVRAAVPATTRESCGVWVALPATTRESCGVWVAVPATTRESCGVCVWCVVPASVVWCAVPATTRRVGQSQAGCRLCACGVLCCAVPASTRRARQRQPHCRCSLTQLTGRPECRGCHPMR